MDEYTNVLGEILEELRYLNQNLESYKQEASSGTKWQNTPTIYSMIDEINDNVKGIKSTTESIESNME